MYYEYGMKQRGFSPGCQPKEGLIGRRDDLNGRYYDILIYSKMLCQKDERHYDLDYLGYVSDYDEDNEESWARDEVESVMVAACKDGNNGAEPWTLDVDDYLRGLPKVREREP